MGWFGRGIGDFGSQVGQGYDINLGWKERLQQMAMEQARQKLADLKGPLELQELQQRIKQMGQPQPAGIVKGPGGETSGVTFDPATSTYSIKTLIPGAAPEPKFPTLQAAAAYYTQHGDWEKLKLINDEIDRNKPQQKTTEGFSDVRPDIHGRLWGFNKQTNQWELVPVNARFPIPHEGQGSAPGDVDALAYDIAAGKALLPGGKFGAQVATRMKQLGLEPPLRKPPKPVPPDVLAMLNGPIPKNPTPEQSRRLADAADRMFGGTAYKQDLIDRGRRSPLLGLRSPYSAQGYDEGEYASIVNHLKEAAQAPPSDFSEVVK
jgi:hypothetical protein